jgi:large subunit ribosomal protein L3
MRRRACRWVDTGGATSYIAAPFRSAGARRPARAWENPAVPVQLLCRKIGNTQLFVESGECIPVCVLQAGSNTVVQKKTEDKDGYTALQLGFVDRKPSRTARPVAGHYQKAGVAPKRFLNECRVTLQEAEAYEVGQEIQVDVFEAGQHVDVTGTSKGRGFTGVVKRHNFAVKRRTHGTHENTRHGGAIGAGSYPGRVFKGMHMAGQMGNERVTVKNLEVVRVDGERGLLYVKGSVPGHRNGIVRVRPTKKAQQ